MAKHKFEGGYNPLDEIKDKILKGIFREQGSWKLKELK